MEEGEKERMTWRQYMNIKYIYLIVVAPTASLQQTVHTLSHVTSEVLEGVVTCFLALVHT